MMNPETWASNISLLLLFLFYGVCKSTDTITPNQSMKDGDLLVSKGETFALGFFSPAGNGSSSSTATTRRYVGIWYNKISEQTVVWVANRDNPIYGTSGGEISINQHGNLVVYDHTRNVTLWQTNVSSAAAEIATSRSSSYSYSARLLDSGNLVLFFQGNTTINGGSGVAWQSFDYPTDTWLPNMKLGLDRRTGLDRFLTSWKSRDDPGTGEYSYRMDPGVLPQFFLRKGLSPSGRTGPSIGNKWSPLPETLPSFIANSISYVDNNEELYVICGMTKPSIVWRFFVNEFGYVRLSNWNEDNDRWVEFLSAPKDQCDYYGHCGPYGYCIPYNVGMFDCTCFPGYEPRSAQDWYFRDGSAGCKRKRMTLGTCSNGEGFIKVASVKIPDVSGVALSEMNMSKEACEDKCLRNCSCSAYMSGGGGGICVTWYGNLTDTIVLTNGQLDLYVRVDATELAAQQHSKKPRSFHGKKMLIVVASVVIMSILILSLGCWLIIKRRRGLKIQVNDDEKIELIQINDDEKIELPIFDMITISRATNKFCDTNKIGEGGFGHVYKGLLSTGKEIAVKRLSSNSKQGLNEFKNEVILIAKLQHRNLVRLLGCCIHGEERMLIYEYMPNGSLDSLIFGLENTSKSLTWRKRLDIIVGIAQGVLYLHRYSRLRVIHRDLKASNVLLDCEMDPKISDFGLAKVIGGDQSSAKTGRVVGTYGYMSPEYAIDGLFSMKSDVFSFGVIVLEILSGKRNRSFHHPNHDLNLLGHAWTLWIEGKAIELLDPFVEGSFPISEVLRCIQVGLLCVQKCPEDRPTMSDVLLMIITEATVLPQPKQPGFYIERNSSDANYLQAEGAPSNNEMSMTQLEAR